MGHLIFLSLCFAVYKSMIILAHITCWISQYSTEIADVRLIFQKYSVAEKCCQSKVYATIIMVYNRNQAAWGYFWASLCICSLTSHVHLQWKRDFKIKVSLKVDKKLSPNRECPSTPTWGYRFFSSQFCLILFLCVLKSTILAGKGGRDSFERRIVVGQGTVGFEKTPQGFDSQCLKSHTADDGRARGDSNPAISTSLTPCPTRGSNNPRCCPTLR